uniref:CCDC81 HU domain-containing protein n=1 Tax=Chromera velia CCMP2878 TaxID=1169474 RepID=A0A0G4I9G0_9ALVE|eukprot:Cvel_12227.t1-p1 / transcript=Cvel_12227.t1 / gene=Cvel_12227 / organism=Chromera_velia_CCMP2878 / gene_product=hypothetical protein / transcript_product=hypothetical protein / location=Cvel_scaffold791:51069-52789(+) / protein_length=326 / sequence_SO=supercontig / SO=protein_coding / is_pseudo=false
MPPVEVRGIVSHLLKNPHHYPGKHNTPQSRTSQGTNPLDSTRQLLLIWDAMCNYIQEQLEQSRSVCIQGLGTFTFEQHVTPTNTDSHFCKDRTILRPCFVCDPKLQDKLHRFRPKEELRGEYTNPGTVYQIGREVQYLNFAPIAAGCYVRPDVVRDAIRAMVKAVCNLVSRDYSLVLDFKFCQVRMLDRGLSFTFRQSIKGTAQNFLDTKPKCGPEVAVSRRWTTSHLSRSMMNYLPRPDSPNVTRKRSLTAQIGQLSLDLNSVDKTYYSERRDYQPNIQFEATFGITGKGLGGALGGDTMNSLNIAPDAMPAGGQTAALLAGVAD